VKFIPTDVAYTSAQAPPRLGLPPPPCVPLAKKGLWNSHRHVPMHRGGVECVGSIPVDAAHKMPTRPPKPPPRLGLPPPPCVPLNKKELWNSHRRVLMHRRGVEHVGLVPANVALTSAQAPTEAWTTTSPLCPPC
jgi:hypothetical protein